MSTVNLDPVSQILSIRLPPTGTASNVLSYLTNAIYTSSAFVTGCIHAVTLAYDIFGGNIQDIELEERNVYQLYQKAVTKYSALINKHHAKNILFQMLGVPTSSFDWSGNITTGSDASLKNPLFTLAYSRDIAMAFGSEIGVGGKNPIYSASFDIVANQQDYDLQALMESSSEFSGIVDGKRILVKEVFFRTRPTHWRFFGGFLGNYASVGGMSNYSGYANSSYFMVTPVWETKLAMANMEDALWTRTSHFSYEIVNNKLRIYPVPSGSSPEKMWFRFSMEIDPLSGSGAMDSSYINGVNNLNSLPLGNIPYENINGPGQDWIREYFIALCARTLAFVRGKHQSYPLQGGRSITMNHADLLSVGREDLEKLEEKLVKDLDSMVRSELARQKKEEVENALAVQNNTPLFIYIK